MQGFSCGSEGNYFTEGPKNNQKDIFPFSSKVESFW